MQAAPDLRPLGVGDIVDRVFAIYRSRFVMLLAVAAIPDLILVLYVAVVGLVFAGSILTFGAAAGAAAFRLPSPEVIAGLVGFGLLVVAGAIVLALVQSASLIAAVASRYMGTEITIGSALRAGLGSAVRLLAMGFIAFLGFLVPWIVLAIAAGVASVSGAGGLVALVLFLGFVAAIVASFFLAASWMVAPAVLILERVGPLDALRRAWHLAGGNRWRIVGLMVLLLVLQVVVSALLSAVLLISFVTNATVQALVQQAVNIVSGIVWAPVYWGSFALLYYDLRVRKEGLDLQLAAEALTRAT